MIMLNTPVASAANIERIERHLEFNGWVWLPGACNDTAEFSDLLSHICPRVTFDPARENSSANTQKVNAGTDAIGLHIENGNTPLVPDIVAFYSKRAAITGSQTTFCDGVELLQAMPKGLHALFDQGIHVQRTLPRYLWQRYVAGVMCIDDPETVSRDDLQRFLATLPEQSGELDQHDNLLYSLRIQPLRRDNFCGQKAFANALLGPSFNYQAPRYVFDDGKEISATALTQVSQLAERCTREVPWADGDILVLDNKRVLHGRRPIIGPLNDRQLLIGMGNRG